MAFSMFEERAIHLMACSRIYETTPLYFETPHKFLNLVIEIKTFLSPLALFLELKKMEFLLGRKKEAVLTDRPLDLDILFYEDLVFESEILQIPHPRAFERAFVMVPLMELARDLRDPRSGKRLFEIYAENRAYLEAQELSPINQGAL